VAPCQCLPWADLIELAAAIAAVNCPWREVLAFAQHAAVRGTHFTDVSVALPAALPSMRPGVQWRSVRAFGSRLLHEGRRSSDFAAGFTRAFGVEHLTDAASFLRTTLFFLRLCICARLRNSGSPICLCWLLARSLWLPEGTVASSTAFYSWTCLLLMPVGRADLFRFFRLHAARFPAFCL